MNVSIPPDNTKIIVSPWWHQNQHFATVALICVSELSKEEVTTSKVSSNQNDF